MYDHTFFEEDYTPSEKGWSSYSLSLEAKAFVVQILRIDQGSVKAVQRFFPAIAIVLKSLTLPVKGLGN